jgi:ATP-dependent DNA helicase RecG
MNSDGIKKLLEQGEGLEVEFKLASGLLPNNAFDTVCAFLNRRGGHLLLGVNDSGVVEGVHENAVQNIVKNIITISNNPEKLTPTFYLSPEIIDYQDKKIVYVFVPESSQVHSTSGKIFDRNNDGDFKITSRPQLVADLYIRKQQTYTENRIYPALALSDLREDLFTRIKKLARSQRPDHPWLELNDMELVKSAGLFLKDYQTGKEGFTLSAILLLGKDEIIQQVLPQYRTDAIYRVNNTDRYDDRDDIRTNLIDAYDRLMAFIAKHLPDKFFQDDGQRINIRDRLFREVVANLLVHRELSNAYPAKLIISKENLSTENWNKPHGKGLIDPALFAPFPKNPAIARFFKEIGRVEELGSGIRNIYKYSKLYTPHGSPQLVEGDIFKTSIPVEFSILKIDFQDLAGITDKDNIDQAFDQNEIPYILSQKQTYWKKVLRYCIKPKSRKQILQELLLITNQTKNFNNYITPLLEFGLLERTIKKNLKAPDQKYIITGKGHQVLKTLYKHLPKN